MDSRSGEIAVFIVAAECESFSAAGRKLDMSPSAVSKLVSRIEDRLSTSLFIRSTRGLQLTMEGNLYFDKARRILEDLDDVERRISLGVNASPKGRLRVSASVGFGEACLLPLVPKFVEEYPDIELDISLTDAVVDLIEERTDIAIRSGALPDSSLKARRLLESPRSIVASPDYLKKHGKPATPCDLKEHNCLRFNFNRGINEWAFYDFQSGAVINIPISGNVYGNSGSILRNLALNHLGLAKIGHFHVEQDIQEGSLVEVLKEYRTLELEQIHAVYIGHDHLATRVRAFIDFMVKML